MTMHWTQIVLPISFSIYFGAVAVVMARVKRRTGANPVGHTGGQRAAALLNAVALALVWVTGPAYVLTARSVDWFGRLAFLEAPLARGLGALACALACLLLVWGAVSLGRSFRMALPESKQPLATHGLYRWIRNPLALSIDLLALGILLLAPSWPALLAFVLTVVSYERKICIEEDYLREAHGEVYAEYCARTGGYLPRLSG
jgi:protein-S-isoprenylcysteine O-methyltransferase Ste14